MEAKQEEIRKRLQLAGKDSKPSLAAAQDYYTSTEMAQFQQPKKKRVSVLHSSLGNCLPAFLNSAPQEARSCTLLWFRPACCSVRN